MQHAEGNAADWFLDRHIRTGLAARTAFRDPFRSVTYGALAEASARFADGLRRAGIARERRVAMLMLDTIDFPIVFWGCLRAGVVPVPINPLLTPDTMGYILADSRAEALVLSAPLLPAFQSELAAAGDLRLVVLAQADGGDSAPADPRHTALPDLLAGGDPDAPLTPCSPDEVAFWLYSSGSTGAPKGVRHVHASLRHTADSYAAQVLGIVRDDVMFSAAKAFHAYGLGNSMTFPMSVAAQAVLLPERPTPDAVLATLARERPTLFAGVPTLYAGLLANPLICPGAGSDRLRRCISAGEALPAELGRRWRMLVGLDILDGIGSTEMLHIFISNRPDDVAYGSSGRPVPGYEAMVVDEHERPAPFGELGELIVKGPSAAEGYWNQRARSRRTFRGEWTWTGDKYTCDERGYFRFCGRADEMLKVSGVWVSPFEVEEALIGHPAVLEAAVVGREDRDGLTKPKAFVVLTEAGRGMDPDALIGTLQSHVKEQIGVWKYPRWIEFADSLPKTATGKIQRFRLREV